MKYVVIETGGKQYKASEGDILEVEKLNSAEGQEFKFEKVLLYTADGVCQVGQPNLEDIIVTAKILGQMRGPKIRVGKFKAKARYRRVTGHRQALTKVQIQSIAAKGEKATKSAAKPEKTKTTSKKEQE
jgi:large subunit ribosomal protein L21